MLKIISKRLISLSIFFSLIFIAFSCSSQWHHPYNQITPDFNLNGTGNVAVIAYDNRVDLKDGKIISSQVGTLKPLTGDDVKIYTASGRTLAEDISIAICNGFKKQQHKCSFLIAKTENKFEHLNFAKKRFNPQRIVYIKITDWFAEIFLNPKIQYDFEIEVYNPNADLLSSLEISGEEKIPLRGINPAQSASTSVPKTLEEVLESLVNHPRVMDSLRVYNDIELLRN